MSTNKPSDAISCMEHLREYIIALYPEKFPLCKKPGFSLVTTEIKDLISKYYNLRNLMEP